MLSVANALSGPLEGRRGNSQPLFRTFSIETLPSDYPPRPMTPPIFPILEAKRRRENNSERALEEMGNILANLPLAKVEPETPRHIRNARILDGWSYYDDAIMEQSSLCSTPELVPATFVWFGPEVATIFFTYGW